MQRISWIDTLKGVLLFLICLSHFSNLSYPIKYLIAPTASYWVPMFFVLSGYLYQDKRSFKNYIHKKTKTLLIPYFFFSFLFSIADPNTYKNFLGGGGIVENIYSIIIVGSGSFKAQPLWFVWVLYGSSIVSFIMIEYIKNNFLKVITILTLSGITLLLSMSQINCLFHIDLILSATVFFTCGYLGRKFIESFKLFYAMAIFTLLVGLIGFWINLGDFHFNQIINYPLFYICPVSLTLSLSIWLKRSKEISPLSWIAKNGIIILASHCYLIFTYDFIIKKYNLYFSSNVNFFMQAIFVFGLLAIIIVPIINRYCFWAIGKKQ